MAGRYSTLGIMIFGFQLFIAFLTGIGFMGLNNIPADTSNINTNSLATVANVSSCIGLPFSCTSIFIVGGALLSSVLFFGAWAYGLVLWIGFYGSALMDIHFTMVNMFGIPTSAALVIDLVCLSAFLADTVFLYSWRDLSAG